MDNSEYISKRNLWTEWVTIGVVPQKENQSERLKFISEKLIYHVPFVKNINSKLYLSKKILLCKSGTNEAILYDVNDWEILTDRELTDKGTTWNHRKEKYIAFHLDNAKSITTPDKISPLRFRYATQEGLNLYLQNPTLDKGCFYLTNPDAARLYQELQKQNIDFKINWGNNDSDPSMLEFLIKDLKIYSSDKYPDLHFKYDNETVSLKSVLEIIQL
jgi:hypothetical protein